MFLSKEHVEECEYEDVKCPDPNCKFVMPRGRLENHQKNECQWRVVVCDYCEDKYAVCKEEVGRKFLSFHFVYGFNFTVFFLMIWKFYTR